MMIFNRNSFLVAEIRNALDEKDLEISINNDTIVVKAITKDLINNKITEKPLSPKDKTALTNLMITKEFKEVII